MNLEVFQGKTLLIVDDEPDLRGPLVTEFESLGCRVFEAANGRQAFEIIRREKIDAVVSDIRMPGGDGVELLRNIKTLHHDFPVVMLITGFSDLSREEAYDLGAEVILAKPFNLDDIDNAVLRILTPRAERWASQPDEARIRRTIERQFEELAKSEASGELRVGRGGIFLGSSDSQPLLGEAVRIDIRFATGEILHIEGTGIARWVRRDGSLNLPPGYGLEFESLSPSTREKILTLTEALKLTAYIPKM